MKRKQIVARLFELSQGFYITHFKKKKQPWPVNRLELLNYPDNSLGQALGQFLTANGFELISKVERHDCYHVLLNFGTDAQDEIGLQYICLANGKRSKYLFGVIALGTLLLPEYLPYYWRCFKLGKQLNAFHHLDYLPLLHTDLDDLRRTICTRSQIDRLKLIQQH